MKAAAMLELVLSPLVFRLRALSGQKQVGQLLRKHMRPDGEIRSSVYIFFRSAQKCALARSSFHLLHSGGQYLDGRKMAPW